MVVATVLAALLMESKRSTELANECDRPEGERTLVVDVQLDSEGTLDGERAAQKSGQPLRQNHVWDLKRV